MEFILWATKDNPLIGLSIGLMIFVFIFLLKPAVMWIYGKNKK